MDRFVGKRLDGRYEIREIIGVGGMAVVYKAHDNVENRTVAVKILKEEFISNEEFLRRFKNESKAIAMLSHPNIVKVYDVSFGDLIQYIVMEHIEGITLKEFIEKQGSLRWKDAVFFTMQILKALQHAHDKGIVHRDVKPQNIMVLPDGTIKVTDFGIARFARSDQRTITDKAIGSVHYISPEQARGEKTDEKADIYSVGVMLYEMITGCLPFEAESAVSVAIMQLQREPKLPTEINGSIPLGLEQITMHAMQKTPERRYQSAGEMLYDLDSFRRDPAMTFKYTYFVDDSPTKFVGQIGTNEIAPEEAKTEEKPKSTMIPVLAGIAATFFVALIVLAAIFLPSLFSSTGKEIECPEFVGQTIEAIKKNSEYTDTFDLKEKYENNNKYPSGTVFEQSETIGKKLKKGAKITLYISMGPSKKKVPDVAGKTLSAADSELRNSYGFTTVITEMASDEVEKGLVIKTDPPYKSKVEEGAEIKIFVSTGKPTKYVTVPDVEGMTKEDAEKELTDEGLVVDFKDIQITSDDKYYPIGYCVKQSPEGKTANTAEGTKVTVYVCTGYKFDIEVELPDDLKVDTYNISLWQNGALFDKGNIIDLTKNTYTFKNLVSKENTAEFTVKISKDGKEYKIYDIMVNNKENLREVTKKHDNYPKEDKSN